MTMRESFSMVDNVCLNAVRGISDLVMVPGLINVDFADVRTIMTGMGRALMGSGRGAGDKRAIEAAEMAINSPLLEDVSINGATGILVNITGGADLTLAEVNEACSLIQEAADPDANIIFGSVIDPNCGDEVRITVIATGFTARASTEIHPHQVAAGLRQGHGHRSRWPWRAQPAPGSAPDAAADVGDVAGSIQVPGGYAIAQQVPAYAPVAAAHAPSSALTPYPPAPLGSPYATASDYDPDTAPDGYGPGSFMHAPLTAHVGAVPGQEWGPSSGPPSIRPPVASPLSPGQGGPGPGRRNAAGGGQPSLGGDDLGIEESEYDTPAYLRRSRGTGAQANAGGTSAHDYAALGYRMPADK